VELSETCRVLYQINLRNSASLAFIIRIYHDARSSECQICFLYVAVFQASKNGSRHLTDNEFEFIDLMWQLLQTTAVLSLIILLNLFKIQLQNLSNLKLFDARIYCNIVTSF
jgi:hypothetical protein